MAKLYVVFTLLVLILATSLSSSDGSKLHQAKFKSRMHGNHLVKRVARQMPICCSNRDGRSCCWGSNQQQPSSCECV
ncbi:hypothetical protein DdX_22279 [Ditylenchus destructor]|uniref:Conotoxin n=1 Tax=Ditylenchus destructor TaxID=166010 RepID=A0AAD4MDT6_9BILA|nr:hypothetical protein DdX_22279 [Ditylenchus destructor]